MWFNRHANVFDALRIVKSVEKECRYHLFLFDSGYVGLTIETVDDEVIEYMYIDHDWYFASDDEVSHIHELYDMYGYEGPYYE